MKTLTAAIAALCLAAPAFAASMTIEFVPDDGSESGAWTFDMDTMTATAPDGSTRPYSWDQETMTICDASEGGEAGCVTFTDPSSEEAEVGGTSTYETSDGATGMATITAMTE